MESFPFQPRPKLDSIAAQTGVLRQEGQRSSPLALFQRGQGNIDRPAFGKPWLGTSADDSDFAMEGMKVFDDRANRRDLFDRSHDAKCVQQLRRLYIAQSVLFNRPYFRRSWVRQEVSVAKKVLVYCGKLCVSWSTMKRSSSRLHEIYKKFRTEDSSLELDPPKETLGLRYMRRNWVWGQTVTGCIGNIRSLWYYHAGGFLDLLMTGRDFNATDPRDKVYSVLGLARVSTQAATKGSFIDIVDHLLDVTASAVDVADRGHSSSVTEEILAKKVRPFNASSDLRRQ